MPQSALSSPVSGAKLAENGHLSRISRKAVGQFLCSSDLLAERVGFEPTLPFRVNTLSKRAPSATRPSLRLESDGRIDPYRSVLLTANPGGFAAVSFFLILWVQSPKPQLERRAATANSTGL